MGLGVETGGFRDRGWRRVGLGIGGWRRIGLGVGMGRFRGIFKEGGVGCIPLDLVFCSEDHLQ